jgi:Flp pilus assembly protein TadG
MKILRLIRIRRFARNEKGGTLAELAILIPFLILMVATVAELGRLFQTYTTLSKATRTAARYLSNNAYEDKYINQAKQMALCGKTTCAGGDEVAKNLSVDNIVITPEFQDGGGGNPITVTVSITDYNFQPLFNLAALFNVAEYAEFPVRPSTTMYYMWIDPAGAEE